MVIIVVVNTHLHQWVLACFRWPGESAGGPDRGLLRHASVTTGPPEREDGVPTEAGRPGAGVPRAQTETRGRGDQDQQPGQWDAEDGDQEQQEQVSLVTGVLIKVEQVSQGERYRLHIVCMDK